MNLIKYEAARTALAECKATDEVKEWIDRSAAMQAYQRMAGDKSLEIDAAEIRIRAERKLGELIAAQKSEFGLNKGGRPSNKTGSEEEPVLNKPPTLSEVGINKKLSSRAQKLAAVPEDEFESEVSEWRDRVGQENARVTARLEKAGEKALKNPIIDVVHSQEEQNDDDFNWQPDDAHTIKEQQDKINDLEEENEKLRTALAINQVPEGLEIEDADTIIDTLRAKVKLLEIEVKAIASSRDSYMRENTQLKEQVRKQAAQLKKMGVASNA
jgi:hypothetical protein